MREHPATPAGRAAAGLAPAARSPAGRVPRELRPWVGGDGPDGMGDVRVRCRPSGWAVVIESVRSVVALGLVAGLVAITLAAWGRWGVYRGEFLLYVAIAVGLRLAWQGVVVACRRYAITDRYVLRVSGVFARGASSLPVGRVQHVVLHRTLLERLTGTGTLGFATAGTGGVEIAWVTVARPIARLKEVRAVIEGRENADEGGDRLAESGADAAGETPAPPGTPTPRDSDSAAVVIGLAGGIGAGKSALALAFAELGCVVADSDKAAREALDREDIRRQLVAWWGEGVLGEDGRIDRKKVAAVVFADSSDRERLEALIHPLVRQGRAELVERARLAGAPAVVVDAPLLFEAGLDSECDVIVFVEAPLGIRLARVRETRGWDEAELIRREKVQLPLDEKRQRSDYEVVNDADADRLRVVARRTLDQILAIHRGNGSGEPGPGAG